MKWFHHIRERFLSARRLDRPVCADEAIRGYMANLGPLPEYETLFAGIDDEYLISRDQACFLKRFVMERKVRDIVEFGAGASSLIFASALADAGGGRLTSVEERPEWCADTWNRVLRYDTVDAKLIESGLRLRTDRRGMFFTYADAEPLIGQRAPFDLALIDAPQWCYGRDGGLHAVYPYLRPGASVILDDAARIMERWTLARWMSLYPALRLDLYRPDFAKGVAVLTKTGDDGIRFSPSAFLTSIYHTFRHRKHRRKLRW